MKRNLSFKTIIYIDDVNMLNSINTSISQKDLNMSLSFWDTVSSECSRWMLMSWGL